MKGVLTEEEYEDACKFEIRKVPGKAKNGVEAVVLMLMDDWRTAKRSPLLSPEVEYFGISDKKIIYLEGGEDYEKSRASKQAQYHKNLIQETLTIFLLDPNLIPEEYFARTTPTFTKYLLDHTHTMRDD